MRMSAPQPSVSGALRGKPLGLAANAPRRTTWSASSADLHVAPIHHADVEDVEPPPHASRGGLRSSSCRRPCSPDPPTDVRLGGTACQRPRAAAARLSDPGYRR